MKYFVFLIFLTVISCKKDYHFPDITQDGKGTFGCIIDGKKYVPERQDFIFGQKVISTRLSALDGGKYYLLVISVSNDKTDTFGYVKIAYHGVLDNLRAGKYSVTDPTIIGGGFSAENNQGLFLQERYSTTENTEGTITILKFDRKARIISGTFEFPMFHNETAERIEVTEGRFDLKIE